MAYLRTRLGRWFYEEGGVDASGGKPGEPTIVLLHSLLCDSGMWKGQMGPLRALGRVVAIDGPGHGRSEVAPPFSLEDHASALIEAFDQLQIKRALIVGLSWGGMLGMRVALSHPKRLAGMVLLDTSADGTLFRERLEYRAMCALALRIGLPPAMVKKKIVPLMFSEATRTNKPELVLEFERSLGGFPIEGVTRAVAAVSIDRPSILERIREIRVPTLVGYGEEDVATPAEHSRRIASRIAGTILVPFEGVGHLSALEDPALVNESVLPFVKDHLRA